MPSLSIIIPTFNRTEPLNRAIQTSLSIPLKGKEVIVVPNGGKDAWETVASLHADHKQVRFCPSPRAGVSAARNHGASLARGDFIRFLDDDDWLLADDCAAQVLELARSGADISTGRISMRWDRGRKFVLRSPTETDDFGIATLVPERLTIPLPHVFRREAALAVAWDEHKSLYEDMDWMMRLCAIRQWKWMRCPRTVGVWYQHRGPRLSRGKDPGADVLRASAQTVLHVYDELERQQRLDEDRAKAVSQALWGFFQKGYQYDRAFWINMASRAEEISPGQCPPSMIHRANHALGLSPAALETLISPIRRLRRWYGTRN